MKKYILSTLFVLAGGLSASASAVSLDVSDYQFVSSATTADAFGQSGSTSVAGAITDVDLSSFIYVPSGSEFPSMEISLGFDSAVADQTGTDLSFFFIGGGTSNSIDLSIGGTNISYNASEILYTDATQNFVYTTTTSSGVEYALSAIFVDMSDFGVSSVTDMTVTLDKGNYLSLVAANPAPVSPVPVPAAVWLFATGLLAMAGVARRKA